MCTPLRSPQRPTAPDRAARALASPGHWGSCDLLGGRGRGASSDFPGCSITGRKKFPSLGWGGPWAGAPGSPGCQAWGEIGVWQESEGCSLSRAALPSSPCPGGILWLVYHKSHPDRPSCLGRVGESSAPPQRLLWG